MSLRRGSRGDLSRGLPPTNGYGWCGLCRRTWAHVEHHDTKYSASSGCFPLCEECWSWLEVPERRIPFYVVLVEQWARSGHPVSTQTMDDMTDAVLAGG